jgi:hypothetical protein
VSWNSSTSSCRSAAGSAQQRLVVAQQLVRAQQDLGEVDQAGALAALLVFLVGLQQRGAVERRRGTWMCSGAGPRPSAR